MIKVPILCTLIGLLLAANSDLSAQSQQLEDPMYTVETMSKNPDVATLGSYGDIPIDKYNGTANITIPIYNVSLDGLSIPLNLSYNTSGIKVNEDATWIGLGWNLSEGIMITKETNGFDDTQNTSEAIGWIFSDFPEVIKTDDFSFDINSTELYNIHTQYNSNVRTDFEPDIFTVSTPNGSAKFYLEKKVSGSNIVKGVLLDERGFLVSYDVVAKLFEVTDPMGFQYTFDVIDYSSSFSTNEDASNKTEAIQRVYYDQPGQSSANVITNWKVSHIESPYGNDLDFSYQQGFFYSFPSFSYNTNIGYSQGNYPTQYVPESETINPDRIVASFTAFRKNYLTEIEGDFGTIDFQLSNRVDLFHHSDLVIFGGSSAWSPSGIGSPLTYSGKRLSTIIVNDYNDNEVLRATLDNDQYFNQPKLGTSDESRYLRLKLDAVTVEDKQYQFEYYQANSLPAKDSNGQDFWGFYNGQDNNAHLIPSFNRFYLIYGGGTNNDKFWEKYLKSNGVNRGSNFNFGEYGILTKVTYPTKGYTMFAYEANAVTLQKPFYDANDVIYDSDGIITKSGLNNSANYHYNYQYLKLAEDPGYSFFDYPTSRTECVSTYTNYNTNVNFSTSDNDFCSATTKNIKVSYSISYTGSCNGASSGSGNAIWLEEVNTGLKTIVYSYDNMSCPGGASGTWEGNIDINKTYVLKKQNFFYNGQVVFAVNNAQASVYSDVLNTENLYEYKFEEFEVGGARIASVSHFDSDNTLESKVLYNYDYLNPNALSSSTGKLMDELVFTGFLGGLFDYSVERTAQDPKFGSSSKIQSNPSAHGSHIGYSRVKETKVDILNQNQGYVITLFENRPNEYLKREIGTTVGELLSLGSCGWSPATVYDLDCYGSFLTATYGQVYFLNAKPKSYDYINGNTLFEYVYDASDNLLMETSNTYTEYSTAPTFTTITGAQGNITNYGPHMFHFPKMAYFANQFLITYPFRKMKLEDYYSHLHQRLNQTTTIQYKNGLSMTNTTNYYYNNLLKKISSVEKQDSNNELNVVKTYYPDDLAATSLIAENRLAIPLKVENLKGTSLLNTKEIYYSNALATNGLLLPEEVLTTQGSTSYTEALYEIYSTKGRILQFRPSDMDKSTTFLWGYNQQYPVAKIENATFAQVASALGVTESNLASRQNNLYLSNINALRTTLSAAMITTYVYKPLIGVETVTDPNGLTTTYTYDSFGRLYQVLDHEGNVLKQNNYNYKH